MTSNSTTKPSMRTTSASDQPPQTAANNYRPSVPISVYRELSAELQATQAMLDSVNAQNQQLVQQNQQLRQEVEKVVQTALHLQQVVDSFESGSSDSAVSAQNSPDVRTEPHSSQAKRRPSQSRPRPVPTAPTVEVIPPTHKSEPIPSSAFSENIGTEQEEGRYRRPSLPEHASEVSGWWLVVVIFLIVATAFGTGFLIVRPLLNSR